MRLAIIGKQGAGKSTLFKAFTGTDPGPITSPHSLPVSVVRVRDPRLEWLREQYQPRKYTPVAVEVRDFPGLPEPSDANSVKLGELLAAAREADGLVVCVRGFEDAAYAYANPKPNPVADAADVETELALADLEIAERRIEKLVKKGGNRTADEKMEHAALDKVAVALGEGRPVKSVELNDTEKKLIRGFRFLTEKPWVLVVSLPDEGGEVDLAGFEDTYEARVTVRASIEAEVCELPEEDRGVFMEELGLTELANESVLRTAFEALETIAFFTTGEDEVRAWTVSNGASAVDAAGAIHSDLARGFIRAEVYSYDDLVEAEGDEAAVKKAGKFRLEGKTYLVQDGDIFHVRFSV